MRWRLALQPQCPTCGAGQGQEESEQGGHTGCRLYGWRRAWQLECPTYGAEQGQGEAEQGGHPGYRLYGLCVRNMSGL